MDVVLFRVGAVGKIRFANTVDELKKVLATEYENEHVSLKYMRPSGVVQCRFLKVSDAAIFDTYEKVPVLLDMFASEAVPSTALL